MQLPFSESSLKAMNKRSSYNVNIILSGLYLTENKVIYTSVKVMFGVSLFPLCFNVARSPVT